MHFVTPFKYQIQKCHLINKHTALSMLKINNDIVKKEIRAANVGLSLNIMTKIATDIRYGKNIFNLDLFILELLLGYYTYGLDRYRDDNAIDNRQYIYEIVFIIIISIISNTIDTFTAFPFEILIYSTKYYKDLKPHLYIFKSFYIAILWSVSVIILPSVLHDGNFNVLQQPLDYIPYILLLMSTSNNKDLDDIEDDTKNNIITMPVKYGKDNAKIFSNCCLIFFILSMYITITEKYQLFLNL